MNKLLCEPVILSSGKDSGGSYMWTNIKDLKQFYNLYLVSDREIGPYEWFYASDHMSINKNEWKNSKALKQEFPWYHKIEATTDKSLGLPLIPKSFIEEYVQKQGKIDKVYIRLECRYGEQQVEIILFDDWDKGPPREEVIIIPVKDSWNREEVEKIAHYAFNKGVEHGCDNEPILNKTDDEIFNEWFDENY